MRRSARQATRAANKARLSGAIIISDAPKNKKIAFADDDDDGAAADVDGGDDDNNLQVQHDGGSEDIHPADRAKDESGTNVDANGTANTENSDDDDDAVEEVTGSAARASTQQSRDVERKISKETASKKKRRKKSDIIVVENASKVENDDAKNEDESVDEDEDEEDMLLTDDFFKMVDSERASHSQQMKQEKKAKKMQQKKLLGKHTTFVIEGDYSTAAGPHPINQNIEVVALGGIGDDRESNNKTTYASGERQLLVSATLGMAPSKAATTFARGSMSSGISKARSSDSRKRQSKDEETWKRSRKMNRLGAGHRPGQAATLFLCKKK